MTWLRFKELFAANVGRALVISVVVGSILVLINHGDHLEQEPICDYFYCKAALCFAVPFMVSIVSAMLAGRRTG